MPGIDSYTKLMLHCNGADGSTSFIDSSSFGHTVTPINNAQIDTSDYKFGGSSALMDGSGDYLQVSNSTDWNLSNEDFTIDCWLKLNSSSPNTTICGRVTNTSNYFYISWEGGNLRFRDYGGSIDFNRTVTETVGTWFHIAIVRSGNNFMIFKDGIQQGTTYVSSASLIDRAVPLEIGAMTQNSSYVIDGYIDEFRWSKGIARWTSNFTPPSYEYGDYTGDETTGKTASASSYYDASYISSNAIDDDDSTAWAGDGNGFPYWWKIDLGTSKIIKKYTIRSRDDSSYTESPKNFTFQGSNDDLNWDVLDSQSGLSWTQAETKHFEINNLTSYRYYRFNITESYISTTNTSFAEVELMTDFNSYRTLMLHCNGTDASTTFIDSSDSNHTITAIGNAQIDTDTIEPSDEYNGVCLLDGSGDLLRIPNSSDFEFGTGDFTIDCWFRFANKTGTQNILAYHTGVAVQFFWNGSNFSVWAGSTVLTTSGLPTINVDEWHHYACVRHGNNWQIYIDGISYASATDSRSLGLPNHTRQIGIGAEVTAPSYSQFWNGCLDEIRVSKGVARWTSNFYPEIESNDLTLDFYENVDIDDTWELQTNPEQQSIPEIVKIDDTWEFLTNPEQQNIEEIVNIDDSWALETNPLIQDIQEEVQIDDSWSLNPFSPTDNLSTIISYNPLVYVTDTDPALITEVDITDPANPIKTVYEISTCKNAKGLLLNDDSDYFYVICAEGKVAKIEKANLNNQTIIDTVETDELTLIDSIDSSFQTFVSTDNSTGELIMIDERTVESLNTDLRFISETSKVINVWINTILGKLINTDLRFIANVNTIINTDLRWLKYSYESISQYPINQTDDWQIKINNVDMVALNDVNMKSIRITHNMDNDSEATFILHRQHDKLNYTNTGVSSEITNNNPVKIYIKGHLEFDGKISNISVDSESETVTITAKMSQPTTKKQSVLVPLTGLNENIHLYDCLADNINIDNPALLITGAVITNSDGMFWDGNDWVGRIKDAQIFSTHAIAQSYIDSNSDWDDYASDEIYPTNASDAIEYYKGIQVNLGKEIEQQITRLINISDVSKLAQKAENGTLEVDQNWEYFWLASFKNFISKIHQGFLQYLGTSLGTLSNDTFKIEGLSYLTQRQYDDKEEDLGWYYIGQPPYSIISSNNGSFLSKDRWEDRPDGLYRVKDESYNYVDFAKRVAGLEYDKLKNINGDIIPITSCSVDLTLDGYYYYGIKLLTRINIDNTVTPGIYKNNNGFPLGVKRITIDSRAMRVICDCDNQLSKEEFDAIDDLYPKEEDYVEPVDETRIHPKFDVEKWGYIV